MWYTEGRDLREQGEPAKAMETLLKVVHSGTDDEGLLGRVHSNIADMCRQAISYDLAYYEYSLSAEHFAASKDDLSYAYALNNMAWERAVMGYKDSALALIRAAESVYPLYPLTDKVIETHALACLQADEYDSALYYTLPPANDYLMMLRAQAYSHLQVNDSATWYARILLTQTDDPEMMDEMFYILMHNAPEEYIDDWSMQQAEVLLTLTQRHNKLMQAVQLLKDDLSARPTNWVAILELFLMGFCCIAAAFVGIVTIIGRRRQLHSQEE